MEHQNINIAIDNRIRVLFLNHSVRDGGPGRSLFYILKYLDREKIDPFVLIPKEGVLTDRLREEGIYENIIVEKKFPENLKKPRSFESRWYREDGNSSSLLLSNLLRATSVAFNLVDLMSLVLASPLTLNRSKIDVIYCNGTQAKIVGAFMGTLSRSPVIWHVRNIQQTKSLGVPINTLASFPAVKRIICVSEATASQFRLGKEKISVIYNGVDPEDYNPEKTEGRLRSEYNIGKETVIVGSTGRVVPRKGYEHMITAAQIVKRELGKEVSNVRFVIVGDTPHFFKENHLVSLKHLVKELGLDDLFIFTGYKEDVRPYLGDFDIFVIPSNYPDPFPRSVLEAMSFAIPAVGFEIGGVAESIQDGVTGIHCEPGDTEQMANSILKLIRNRAMREALGTAGRRRIKRLFSAEDRTKDVEREILNVAANTK